MAGMMSMLRLGVSRHVRFSSESVFYCSYSTNADTSLSSSIRALMRASAQPVAVITSLLPPDQQDHASSYAHGATLSSFSTISLHPPLLAFSLQTPSRMADALQVKQEAGAHFVINILSNKQSDDALKFSKPGLTPFSLGTDWIVKFKIDDDNNNDSDHPFSRSPFHASAFAKDATGVPVPVLSNSLGSLACSIVSVMALKDFETGAEREGKLEEGGNTQSTGSELFLARVHGVEKAVEQNNEGKLPLVYWNQNFTSVKQ